MITVYRALTVSFSAPGGYSGIQADIKTLSAFGVSGSSVVTCVQAENSGGVFSTNLMPVKSIDEQIDAVAKEIQINAVKTGFLHNSEIIEAVAGKIKQYDLKNIVIDPILEYRNLKLDKKAVDAMVKELFPIADIITFTKEEAGVLAQTLISSEADIKSACITLIKKYNLKNVLIKGGRNSSFISSDILYDGQRFHSYHSPLFNTEEIYGAGCTYSAAITAALARGSTLPCCMREAKDYISGAVASGVNVKIGNDMQAVDHLWRLRKL